MRLLLKCSRVSGWTVRVWLNCPCLAELSVSCWNVRVFRWAVRLTETFRIFLSWLRFQWINEWRREKVYSCFAFRGRSPLDKWGVFLMKKCSLDYSLFFCFLKKNEFLIFIRFVELNFETQKRERKRETVCSYFITIFSSNFLCAKFSLLNRW